MKIMIKPVTLFLAASIFFASCSSTTVIQSVPSGANVYINGQKKGTTPYTYSDTKIVGSSTPVVLKKEGYEDLNTTLDRSERADVGAIIAGCFFLVPFLWTMQYDQLHNYELIPLKGSTTTTTTNTAEGLKSTNELIKLKNLLDQGAITTDDFTTLKVKILNNEYDYDNSKADQITKLKGLLDQNLLTRDEYIQQKDKVVNSK